MRRTIKPIIYPYHWNVTGTSMSRFDMDESFYDYRKRWESNPLNSIVADFPLHLDIEITGRCNLMCVQCFRFSRRTDIGDMDMSLFKKIIDEGRKYNLPAINLSWLGESFLHPQLIDMIRYAKNSGVMDIWINTNGTLIDEDMAEKIIESGLNNIIFSVDAVSEETYNRIKCGSDFELINRNIEYLIELRNKKNLIEPRVHIQMIDMKQTHDELTAFIDYWRVRADNVRVAIYQSPDGKPNDRNRIQNKPDSIFPCPQLWQRLVIGWDGNVYACIGDNACRNPLGNLNNCSIYDIWHSRELNELRNMHSNYEADNIEMCMHCDLNKIPKSVKKYNGVLKDAK